MPAQFLQPPGPAGSSCQATGFSNTAILPASARLVITAGQAGCDLTTGALVESSVAAQIEASFDCVDAALKIAGVKKGLGSAHKIVSYLIDCRNEPLMMEIWRRRYPGQRPTWTCIGVSNMCAKGMVCEIQGEAILE
jgi:enamine deaminase RidA (YjgF/YER057c/UK114 family)